MKPQMRPPESVLVIEDDASIAELLRIVLERRGYNVSVTSDCASATAILGTSVPELILLDLMLPDGDGLEVLRWLRDDVGSAVPVVVLTGFRQEEKALRAFDLGAADFISTPFRPRELVARIQRVLALAPAS